MAGKPIQCVLSIKVKRKNHVVVFDAGNDPIEIINTLARQLLKMKAVGDLDEGIQVAEDEIDFIIDTLAAAERATRRRP